jgi:hypothetical protein
VEHGFQKETEYFAGLLEGGRVAEAVNRAGRKDFGLGLFLQIDELHAPSF